MRYLIFLIIFAVILIVSAASANAAFVERRHFQGVLFNTGTPDDWFRSYNPSFPANQEGLRLAQQQAIEALVYFDCNVWSEGATLNSEDRRRKMNGMGFLTTPISQFHRFSSSNKVSFVLSAHQVVNDMEQAVLRTKEVFELDSSCALYPNTIDIPGHSTDEFPKGIDIDIPDSLTLGEPAATALRSTGTISRDQARSDWAVAPINSHAFCGQNCASGDVRQTTPIPFWDGQDVELIDAIRSNRVSFFMVGMEPTTRKPMISENPACNDEITRSLLANRGLSPDGPAPRLSHKCNAYQGFSGGPIVAFVSEYESFGFKSSYFAIGIMTQAHDNRIGVDASGSSEIVPLDYGSELMPHGSLEDRDRVRADYFTPIAGEFLAEMKRN